MLTEIPKISTARIRLGTRSKGIRWRTANEPALEQAAEIPWTSIMLHVKESHPDEAHTNQHAANYRSQEALPTEEIGKYQMPSK